MSQVKQISTLVLELRPGIRVTFLVTSVYIVWTAETEHVEGLIEVAEDAQLIPTIEVHDSRVMHLIEQEQEIPPPYCVLKGRQEWDEWTKIWDA